MPDFPPPAARLPSVTPTCNSISRCLPNKRSNAFRETKRNAAALGRELQMFSTGFVVCRPTQKEAEDYYHYYAVEEADWDAVDRVLELVLGKEGPTGYGGGNGVPPPGTFCRRFWWHAVYRRS